MADYKHEGFDSYGYVEEIKFTPMNAICKVGYTKPANTEPTLKEVESFVKQDYVEQNNLTIPDCKCLRK